VWGVLLGAGGGVYLGYKTGDGNHCRLSENDGGTAPEKIPQAGGAANDDYRTSDDQRLHIPAGRRRRQKVYDISRQAEPVPELAFLAEQSGRPGRLEQGGKKMSRHQSRQALQLRGNRRNQED